MAAGNWIMFDSAKEYIGDGTIDMDDNTFKVLLTTNSYTPNIATHTVKTDVTNELSTGNGYTAGGATLASVTWTHSGSTTKFDSADPVWTASGGSIGPFRRAVIYRSGTVNSVTDALVCHCLLDSDDITVTDTNTYTIQMHASGILTLSGAAS